MSLTNIVITTQEKNKRERGNEKIETGDSQRDGKQHWIKCKTLIKSILI